MLLLCVVGANTNQVTLGRDIYLVHNAPTTCSIHQALVRPADGCADTEAPLAGPYPAYARRPPSAPCSVGAGPTSWTTIPTGQPADGHTPPPKRTNPASRRPPRMGTRWPIPLLSTGKPLRGETPRIIINTSTGSVCSLMRHWSPLYSGRYLIGLDFGTI